MNSMNYRGTFKHQLLSTRNFVYTDRIIICAKFDFYSLSSYAPIGRGSMPIFCCRSDVIICAYRVGESEIRKIVRAY